MQHLDRLPAHPVAAVHVACLNHRSIRHAASPSPPTPPCQGGIPRVIAHRTPLNQKTFHPDPARNPPVNNSASCKPLILNEPRTCSQDIHNLFTHQ